MGQLQCISEMISEPLMWNAIRAGASSAKHELLDLRHFGHTRTAPTNMSLVL